MFYTDWPAIIAGTVLGVLFSLWLFWYADKVDKEQELNPPTKCVQGFKMINVGRSWVYQLIDNKQVPCT